MTGYRNIKLIVLGVVLVVIGAVGLTFPFVPFYTSADFSFLNSVASSRVSRSEGSLAPEDKTSRLKISKIGVDMPIFESEDASVLKDGGWVFPGTSTPDKGANSVIFGHRFKYRPPLSNTFYNLDKVINGDRITITWAGEMYEYEISEIKIIEPTDLSILDSTKKDQITLVTCAPLFSTAQRLVVIAERIQTDLQDVLQDR
ncbi:MAG: sortase [Parcubacteria group bacterium]